MAFEKKESEKMELKPENMFESKKEAIESKDEVVESKKETIENKEEAVHNVVDKTAESKEEEEVVETKDEINEIEESKEEDEIKEKKENKETVNFKERCKLYRRNQTTKGFDLRGEGEIFITEDPETKQIKISMIRDQIKTLGCNHFIDPSSDCLEIKNSQKSLLWYTLTDYCENGRKDSQEQVFAVKFKEESQAKGFKDCYQEGKIVNERIIKEKK